jgi:NADH-quinone oxidoreductase subunit L
MENLVWVIPALPLAGFAVLLLFGTRLGEPVAGWLGTLTVAASFVVSVVVFFWLRDQPEHTHGETLFEWIPAGSFQVDVGYLLDPLSMAMVLFITGVASLIHLYSIGYMHGDPRYPKFFLYLNLFVFSMLVLVLGDNLLLTFVGWEGVGVCSYFLISFWFEKDANAVAGKKAFITNRVGDWGFMVGTFAAFFTFGTIAYEAFLPQASGAAKTAATFIALMLFVGAVGKSAQIPLYIWLPDAMAGPTPVSALIHAATMVTAGVYLMCRVSPVIAASYDWVPTLIAWIGVLTALLAALIATSQYDIKKVLAYSTISQLGYMFLAVGTGAYWAAIFHMITHAFFKALLFLGAGSVIHGMHEGQDMRWMGALRKWMPITSATFIVGWLAISGVPPFSGFWSKDEILAYALQDNVALYAIGLFTALLTAYYMSRQVFMVFYGDARWAESNEAEELARDRAVEAGGELGAGSEGAGSEDLARDVVVSTADPAEDRPDLPEGFTPHESPWTMTLPLAVLAVLAAIAGLLNLPFPDSWHFLENWLEPAFALSNQAHLDYSDATIVVLLLVSSVVAVGGITIAWLVFEKRRLPVVEPVELQNALYIDTAVAAFMGGPGTQLAEGAATFDSVGVDGAVNGVGRVSRWTAARARVVQSGYVRAYALMVGIGSVLLVAFVLTRVLSWS